MDMKSTAAAVAVCMVAAAAMQGLQDTVRALFVLAAVAVGLQAVQAVLQFRAAAQLQSTVQGGMESLLPQMPWMSHFVEGVLTKVVCSSLQSQNRVCFVFVPWRGRFPCSSSSSSSNTQCIKHCSSRVFLQVGYMERRMERFLQEGQETCRHISPIFVEYDAGLCGATCR